MQPGIQRFVADMHQLGFNPTVEAELVEYTVTPIDGGLAGQAVQTGVGLNELASWPQVPPHWIHFPTSVSFHRSNSQSSPKAGWLMHSRQIEDWGDAEPRIGWASHVRAVLSEAVK